MISLMQDEPKTRLSSAVICRGVTKVFGTGEQKVHAVRGVDLEINTGELVLLVGPSGCGKTTLISMIAGLLTPSSGSIQVFGTNLHEIRDSARVRFRGKNIGFVFQQYNLIGALTAAENVAVPLLALGEPRRTALVRARELLTEVGLGNRSDVFPSNLSGGQQQRVAIARALVHDPRLLVCDEPTSALDGNSGQQVMTLLQRVAVQSNRAVIIVTHDNRIFGYGDRIVEMSDGLITHIEMPVR